MRLSKQQRAVLFILLLLGAFALRLFRIENQSYWWDEGISLHLATSTWGELIENRLDNIHPPLYFFLLKIWVGLTGLTPFATRMFSALASLLQVTAVYAVTSHFFNSKRLPVLSAFLIAISPLSIIYAQEVRVYALLPLIFFGLIGVMQKLVQAGEGGQRKHWVFFGLTVWFGLHLHYISAFMVLFVSCWGMVSFLMAKTWHKVRAIFITAVFVTVGSLPWFGALAYNLITIPRTANGYTFLAEPVPLDFLIKQIWLFHFTGLAGALNFDWLLWLGTAAAILVFVILVINLSRFWRNPRVYFLWFAIWFVPLFSALIVWSVRSFSHPRYISMFAMGLFPLIAVLILSFEEAKFPMLKHGLWMLGGGLLTAVVAISSIALYYYYFHPDVQKDDMRSVARFLETAVAPDDIIIIPDTDYSLLFEYNGKAEIVMLDTPNRGALFEKVATLTTNHDTIFFIDYKQETKDWQDFTNFALNNGGVLVNQTQFEDILVNQYGIDTPYAPLTENIHNVPILMDGGMQLHSAQIEVESNKSGAVAIALGWQIQSTPPHRLKGTLRLRDEDGREVAKKTVLFIDRIGRPADLWAFTDTFYTYHTLQIPEGAPPLIYDVTLDLFVEKDDESLTFFDFQSSPPLREWTLGQASLTTLLNQAFAAQPPIPLLDVPLQFGDISLQGAVVDRSELFGGQTAFVQLLWRAEEENLPIIEPELLILQNGDVITAVSNSTLFSRYPTTEWQKGEHVFEVRPFLMPPELSGFVEIDVRVGDVQHSVGTLNVLETDRIFVEPEVQIPLEVVFGETTVLIGLDLPRTEFSSTDTIPITLHWQSNSSEETVPYQIFIHLLDENDNIVGQADVEPLGGIRPFTSWIEGEFITDPLAITLKDPAYEGVLFIGVGIYNPANNTRLLDSEGNGRVMLPVTLDIQK